ncbi:hypothetical protein P0M11_06125 [Kaistella sp. PBT33-4]|uniref:hypothetical protein n=1 Tax=Kaistella sp. PBT33-4 TaxID=3032000 RepID=UPI0023D80A1F|nr:hypothetical protein [Kaistella sp. PBT33-4]MDF0719575.1 hypothetical protein [Kaistella sp. PBT33-4]
MTTVKTLFTRLFLPALFVTSIVSCDSRDDELSNEQYVGAWDWVATTGVNVNENPTNTGKTAQLILTPEGTYTIKENDIVQSQGNYSLYKGVTSTDHVEKMYIDFSNDPDKMVNSVNATDLSLGDDSVNGLTYHYKK